MTAPHRCELPVLDAGMRAGIGNASVTTTRAVEGAPFDARDASAASDDADQPAPVVASTRHAPDLASLIRGAGGHAGRVQGTARKRRVVVRFDPGEIDRLDALRARFPKASRAAIVRAFCLLGASTVEAHHEATMVPTERTVQ